MNTKKIYPLFLMFVLTTTLFLGDLRWVKAQSVDPVGDAVSFQEMKQNDIILTGPTDSGGIGFRLPADWSVQPGSIVHFNISASTGISSDADSEVAGFFDVYLNDTWLTTINLSVDGEYAVDIPIPLDAWATASVNEIQELRFTLVDALRCNVMLYTSETNGFVRGLNVVVRSSSYIDFVHDTKPISTDLKLLPYPVFQGSFKPDQALIVIPDQPTQGELQAAMTVSAAFGRLTVGGLNLQLIKLSELTDNLNMESNIIFIGRPSSFPQLTSVNLPAPYTVDGFENVQIRTEDGILQMVESPQNPSKVWLLVSGQNDVSIMKAAQAVGSNAIQPYGPDNLAVISEIGEDSLSVAKTDFSFEDLGTLQEKVYSGYINDIFGIWFDMPVDQMAVNGAYFELVFTNSAVLNYDESAIKVNVNDSLIGGLRFSDRSTSVTHWKFNIPPYLLHPGRNLLLLEINLSGSSPCILPSELWVAISPKSFLHLPTSAISSDAPRDYDLAGYPDSIYSTFDQTALVLSNNDTSSWSIASKLSFDLGRKLGGSKINIATYFANAIPDEVLQSKDLILIGRPSAMPIIDQFAQVMPAPFETGQDVAQEKDPQYSFLIGNTTSVGYVQVFASPWDPNLAVMTISGNTDEGLNMAATALLTPSTQEQIVGDFVIALKNKVIARRINTPSTIQSQIDVTLPDVQSSNDDEQAGNGGKINIGFPLIALFVVVSLAVIGIVVLLVKDRQEKHGKILDSKSDKDS